MTGALLFVIRKLAVPFGVSGLMVACYRVLTQKAGLGPESQPILHTSCGERCLKDAMVDIFVEEPRPERRCVGVVIANIGKRAVVMTSAHCLFREGAEVPLVVSGAVSDSSGDEVRARARRRWIHPRFSLKAASSAYDLALLELERPMERATYPRVAPGSWRLDPGASVALALEPAGKRDTAGWAHGNVARATGLSFTVATVAPSPCHGMSGTPVVVGGADDMLVVGVISRGAPDCQSDTIDVARASAAITLLEAAHTGRLVEIAPRGCGECIAALSESGEACLSAVTGCREDGACARTLACLESCETASCSKSCGAQGREPLAATTALCRCAVARGCGQECRSACTAEER